VIGLRRRSLASAWLPMMGTRGRLAAAALFALAAAGCATVPSSGPVQQIGADQNGLSQEQEYSQPIAVWPGSGWNPQHIVDGFLAASASFTNNHEVARGYLDPTVEQSWKPGWAVTVVSKPPKITQFRPLPRPVSNQSETLAYVKVTGLPVATISGSGQYQSYSGSPTKSYIFSLIKWNGQWRIDHLPTTSLLLTEADFQQAYQPRDLYFLSPSGRPLVPDPVFVPQQTTNTELATRLVDALLQDPTGWLSGAAVTGFPADAQPIGQVRINGPNATVDLGGRKGESVVFHQGQLEQMAAQLVWTLATGPTPVQSVELELNNRPEPIMGSLYQRLQKYQGWVPSQQAGSRLYFVGGSGAVDALSAAGAGQPESVSAVPGAAGTAGIPPLTSIAVSPDGRSLAGIVAGGAAVYYAALSSGASLQRWRPTSGTCTSVSWDADDDLWVTCGGIVWMLEPGTGSATVVTVDDVPAGSDVTDFRVAPDGVRVAMIVRVSPTVSQLMLGAIVYTSATSSTVLQPPVLIGASITRPDSLSWYGSDDLIVLAGSSANAQLEEVPLNGGQPMVISAPGSPVSVTAANSEGSVSDIAIGLPGGKIMLSTDQGAFQPTRATGIAPVYPG
jgi:hypothetical protein